LVSKIDGNLSEGSTASVLYPQFPPAYQSAWSHISENTNLHNHQCVNLQSHKTMCSLCTRTKWQMQ